MNLSTTTIIASLPLDFGRDSIKSIVIFLQMPSSNGRGCNKLKYVIFSSFSILQTSYSSTICLTNYFIVS